MNDKKSPSRRQDHLVGLALAAAYLAVLLATARDVGYARDEGIYFQAAKSYRAWFQILSDDPGRAIDKRVISKHWRSNREHPALMKTLFGLSNKFFHHKYKLLSVSTSFRLPAMLTASLIIYILYLWGSLAFGRAAGFYAAMAFALMPRVFFHAHLACFDIPITALWLSVCYLYWRSLDSWKFGVAAGVVFGFALSIKLNAFFLPFVLGAHYLWLLTLWLLKRHTTEASSAPQPWAFVSGLIFAPLIFYLHWPWIWHDTFARLGDYVAFHSKHEHYNAAWFGENVIGPKTPILMPITMTILTIPTVIMVSSIAGFLLRLRVHFPHRLRQFVKQFWAVNGAPSSNGLDSLLIILAVFPIALISMPSVPVFGGTKHWIPAFPFIALFAGIGVSRIADVASKMSRRLPETVVKCLIVAFLLLPPLQQTATSHPLGLTSYVPLIGGTPGGATLGMTRQFWGYTTMQVLPWLNANVPKRGGVNFHDTINASLSMYKTEGMLRRDIRPSGIGKSSAALIHHELHMVRNEAWVWNHYGTFTADHILSHHGVPIVSVYKKPGPNRAKRSKKGK